MNSGLKALGGKTAGGNGLQTGTALGDAGERSEVCGRGPLGLRK